ncbi:MAG: LysR substrate-binding domain-containing protein [Opitutales bacterium]
MIDRIQTFLVVIEEGSLNRAALRLGVTQPTLTRQLQSLEAELGGSLVERGNWGVRPTNLGYLLRDKMEPIVDDFEAAWKELQAAGRGQTQRLRVGYLGLSAARYLNPALSALREAFPDLKLELLDLTPVEQIEALESGRLDVAMVGQEAKTICDQYHTISFARLSLNAAVPLGHRLASKTEARLIELKGERFVSAPDEHVPGRNAWISKLCAKAGFKAQFTSAATSLGESFSYALSEGAICLFPDYIEGSPPPGLVFVKITDPDVRWEYLAMRPAGKGSKPTLKLFELLKS